MEIQEVLNPLARIWGRYPSSVQTLSFTVSHTRDCPSTSTQIDDLILSYLENKLIKPHQLMQWEIDKQETLSKFSYFRYYSHNVRFFRKNFCLLYLFFALFILFISVWVFGDPEIHSLQFEIRSVPGKLLCMRHYYTKGHLRISHTSAMRKEHTSLWVCEFNSDENGRG